MIYFHLSNGCVTSFSALNPSDKKAPGVFVSGANNRLGWQKLRIFIGRVWGEFCRALYGRKGELIWYTGGTLYRTISLVLADYPGSEGTFSQVSGQPRDMRAAINLEEPPNAVFAWDLWEAFEACSLLVTTPSPWLLWMKQSQRKQCCWLSTGRASPVLSQSELKQLFWFANPWSRLFWS